MAIYVYMTALSCLTALLAERARSRAGELQKRRGGAAIFWMVASAIPFVLVAALRLDIGTDYAFSYAPEYDALAWHLQGEDPAAVGRLGSVLNAQIHYTNAFHATSLFYYTELLLISLGAGVQWLFVLFAVWTMGLVFLAIYRQSPCPALSIFLFVFSSNYFLSLNIMRQYFAISLCLVAFQPAQQRKLLPFLLLVALAAAFHTTALVFLPVYFLYSVKIRPKVALGIVAAALALSPLTRIALETLVPLVLPKYAWYLDSVFTADGFETLFFLINMAVLLLAAYYYKRGEDKPYFNLWYNANLLGTIFLCFSGVAPLMKRINYYYAACHFLFIPLLLTLEPVRKRRHLLTAAVCLLFIAETVVAVVMLNKNGVYPYASILQPTDAPYFDWVAFHTP